MYNEKMIERLKKRYPAGTRLCLDRMENDPHPIAPGTLGTVLDVDDMGQIIMQWDNGSRLSLIPEADRFHVVKQELAEAEEVGMSMSM